MNCKICGEKIKKHGFSELLNNGESRRAAGLLKGESICLDCKTTMLLLGVLTPWNVNAEKNCL
jgi:hypothetical protein